MGVVTCEGLTARERVAIAGILDQDEPTPSPTILDSLASVACIAEEIKSPALRALGYKLISVAETRLRDEDDLLQVHYYLGAIGTFFYRFRKLDSFALNRAIAAFEQQIQISSDVASMLRASLCQARVAHPGFTHMRVIHENAGEIEKAKSVCKAALDGGWQGDWRGHIRRIEQRHQRKK